MHTYVQWYIRTYVPVLQSFGSCVVWHTGSKHFFMLLDTNVCTRVCMQTYVCTHVCTHVHACVALDCTIHTYVCMCVPLVWNVSTGDGCMYVCMYVLVCAPSANYSCSLRALCSRQSHPPPSLPVPHHCTARSKQGAASSGTPDHRSQRWPVQPRPPL